MNIKRIIREEVDDFDWIKDVSSDFMSFLKQNPSENGIYKIWIEGISMEDQLTMMDKLYDHGFQWRGGHGRYDTSFVNIPILYLETDTMEIQWDRGEDNRDTFEDREYETPKTQIPTDDFFKVLGMSVNNINESDELDWIRDTVTTKLDQNENWILVNDIDRESVAEGHEIQKYLFDLGYDWGVGQVLDSLKDFCIYAIYHYGTVQVGGSQIYYQDGCRDAEVRISNRDIKSGKHMVYYWSDLKPKTIKEETDFEWVNDSEPTMADNIYGGRIPINTKEAKDNFKKEVNGHYVISAPIENENEETVLAFGSVSYVKRVIEHIHKHFPKDHTLYLATIK